MKKTLLKILTLLCTFTTTLGLGTACDQSLGDYGLGEIGTNVKEFFEELGQNAKDFIEGTLNIDLGSSSKKSLVIMGRPETDTVTLSDTSNTLTLSCAEADVVWASSDPSVATVENGVVTLHSAGSTVISVTKGDRKAEFILTVVDGRVSMPIDVTIEKLQLSVGKFQLSAPAFEGEAEWLSRNEKVAIVDENGNVTLLQCGSVEIVAQKKGDASVFCVYKLNIVDSVASSSDLIFEDFSTAVVIGNYVVGEIESRDASNMLSPEIVYDEEADNYYLKYSHAKANGNNRYMVYTFTGLETGARYVLRYNMKVLSHEGSYNHQINLYSDKDVPVIANNPLVGNVYNWHTTGLDTDSAKIYQTGSGALYRDGVRWKDSDKSTDAFHEYTLGFIAGEETVGFAFVCNNTYEALFDYVCVEKAPIVEEYTLTSTRRLPVGESYQLVPVAEEEIIYYQPFKLTYVSSDESVATVDENGVVTAIKPGEVTITATNVNGVMQTAEITVVSTVDRAVYDIFYEETDPLVEDTRLYKEYELEETLAVGATQWDRYTLTLEIDAIYYAGNVQMYLGLVNTKGTLVGQRVWTSDEFPASGEKKTVTFDIELPWASGDFDISKLQVYLRYGTSYQIGVNVVSIEKTIDPNATKYDLWYVGRTESIEQTYELAEAVTGGAQYDTAEVQLSLDLVNGTMPRIKFYLINTDGQQITDPADNGWITVTEGENTVTATFKWATGNWDVGAIKVIAEDGSYRLGVDVVGVEIVKDTTGENYDLWYVGTTESIEQTYEFAEAVTGGAQYDTAKVKLSLDLVNDTMPRIKFYLLNTDGQQITDPADNGWITVTEGENTVTATFKWATGNWNVGAIKVIAEDGSYRLGIDVVGVEIVKDTTGENYDFWYVGTTESIEQTYELAEAVTGGAQYDTAKVKLSLDLVNGTMPRIKFYLLNTDGQQITDPADNGWITVTEGENTVTATFKWATGNWDVGAIKVIAEDGSYRLGVDVVGVEIVKDTTGENYDLWYVGTTESIEQTYTLAEAVTSGAQYDTAEVKLSLDLVNGTMPRIKFYLLNTDGQQITDPAEYSWITVTEGENTVTATFKWATGNWNVGAIKVIAEDGTYRLGVDVVGVEIVKDTTGENYDLWYVGTTQSIEQTYTLTEAVTGGIRYDMAEVKLSLDLVNGTMPRIKFYLINTDGQQITDPAENGWITVTEGENTVTATFKWATGNWNVGAIKVIAEDGTYRLGVDVVSVNVIADTTGDNYDLWYVGRTEAIEQTYELAEAVTGGAQYDTAKVKLSLDLVNGTMPRIKFYLINTDGVQITDPADNGWITVTEGENTVTATFKWATGNWDVGAIKVIAEDGSYRLGVDVVGVEIVKDTTGENYDLWYVGTTESIEQTYTLAEAVTGGAQYDTAKVKLSLDLVNGTMPRIKFYLLNTDGQQITDPAEYSWITVTEGENTVTATFKWATGNWDVGSIKVIAEDGTYRLGVDVVGVEIVKDTTGENYDLWYVGTAESIEQTYELAETVTGGAQYDTAEVKLSLDLVNGTMPRIKFYLLNTDGVQITDPAEYSWITVTEGENTVTATFKWATGNWNVGAIKVIAEDGSYRLGVDFVSVNVIADTTGDNYDLWYVGTTESIEQTHTLTEAVTGGIRYDMAEVKLSLDLVNGTMPRIKFYLLNTDGQQITDPAENGWITVAEGENTVTATFKWATGNWDIGAIKVIAEDGTYRLGIDVNAVEIRETAYQLEYSFASGSQAQVFAFDTVAGGTQNGYVKLTFDVAVFYGTLTNIQFNLCTDTAGSTTVANSNKAWNEDGTKITSSGGQISMDNCTGKKTVTIVTTFPWANGNWDLQSIRLQLYGTNLQAGVSNIQVELVSDFTPVA